jgi:crossover junction endodeoxyribonuclease RuvC
MLVLGIDPGIENLGWGIIEGQGNRLCHIDSGVLHPSKGLSPHEKLYEIHVFSKELFKSFEPGLLAIESVFVSKNIHNTLRLGEVRASVILSAVSCGTICMDIAPRKVKMALVGNGSATKEQVAFMTGRLLGLSETCGLKDRTDALAISICGYWETQRKI